MDNINSAKDRYAKAVENGKKGGRPTEINIEHIQELKDSGLTNKQIATELGCSTRTVERANRQNRQNLDIDIDKEKDIDIEKEKKKDIDTDIAIAIINLFKNKAKYKDIKTKIKTDFDIDISFDDIKQIIDNRDSYIALAEKEKETKRDDYFKQIEYDCIPDIVEKLAAHGITTTYDEIKTAYDKVQNSNLCSKWNIRELGENCYLNGSFIGDTKTLSEYTDKIIKFKDSMYGYGL